MRMQTCTRVMMEIAEGLRVAEQEVARCESAHGAAVMAARGKGPGSRGSRSRWDAADVAAATSRRSKTAMYDMREVALSVLYGDLVSRWQESISATDLVMRLEALIKEGGAR